MRSLRITPNPCSRLLAQSVIAGVGTNVPSTIVPDGSAALLLFVPIEEVTGRDPGTLQTDLGLPWFVEGGDSVWFDELERNTLPTQPSRATGVSATNERQRAHARTTAECRCATVTCFHTLESPQCASCGCAEPYVGGELVVGVFRNAFQPEEIVKVTRKESDPPTDREVAALCDSIVDEATRDRLVERMIARGFIRRYPR